METAAKTLILVKSIEHIASRGTDDWGTDDWGTDDWGSFGPQLSA